MWAILFARSFPSLKPTDHESSLHSAVDSDPNGWRYKTSKLDDGGWDACPSAGKGKQSQLRLPPPFPQSLEPFNNQHNEKNNAPRNRYSRMRRHKLGNVPPMVRQAEVCDAERFMMRAALARRLRNAPWGSQRYLLWCFAAIAGSVRLNSLIKAN